MSYNLEVFKLPATEPQSAAEKPAPAVKKTAPPDGSNPGTKRGYDLSVFDLPEQIEIPQHTKDGKEASEKIHVRDFGKHVRAQVENAMTHGSPEEAAKSLFWSIGTAQGASLMPAPVLKEFEGLGLGFAASKNPKVFFSKNVVPFLKSLRPEKRRK